MFITRQAVLVEPRRIELRETSLAPGPGQLLVKVAACGLCNWEQNHWKGLLGQCPQTLGHEWAGTVVERGRDVTAFDVGDPVTGLPDAMGAFADYLVTAAAGCVKLPPGADPASTPGEPLKCVVTVVRAAAPEAGDIGVVYGCGPMGLWCIQAIGRSLPGALIAVDIAPAKLELARRFGATHTIDPRAEDAATRIREIGGGRLADFVIEGTGIPEVMADAARCLKDGRGRLIVMSAHERAPREFDWRPFQEKALQLVAASPLYSADERDDLLRAMRLVANSTFRMDGILTHCFPLARIQEAFETCERKPADYIKGMVIP